MNARMQGILHADCRTISWQRGGTSLAGDATNATERKCVVVS